MSGWEIAALVGGTWMVLSIVMTVVWHQSAQWNKRKGRFKK